MSTLNLGKLRFNWRGVYDSAQTYTRNDTVKYQQHSFVCITATTTGAFNGSHWAVMAEGMHPATTQGDLLHFKDGMLDRLPVGAAHKILKMGTNGLPQWGGGGSCKMHYKAWNDAQSISTSWVDISNGWIDLTPQSPTSKFLISPQVHIYGAGYGGSFRVKHNASGSYVYVPETGAADSYELYTSNQSIRGQLEKPFVLAPNTTNTFRVQLEGRAYSSSMVVNESNYYYSRIWALEIVE